MTPEAGSRLGPRPEPAKVKCRGCGRSMVWGFTHDEQTRKHTRIPLDASAPVFRIVESPIKNGLNKVERARDAFVSHFATCPKVEWFTKKRTAMAAIQIRFDGPPGPQSGRFIEVETADGKSIGLGRWAQEGSDWLLRFNAELPDVVATARPKTAG